MTIRIPERLDPDLLPTWLQPWWEDCVVAFFTLGITVLLAGPAGLLWSALAPHATVVLRTDAEPAFSNGITEDFIAADGWFAAVTVVVGIASGVLAWRLARGSGPFVVGALAIGGLLAAYLAAKVGMRPDMAELQAAVDAGAQGLFDANVVLKAELLIVLWPTAALAAFLALVLGRPDDVA